MRAKWNHLGEILHTSVGGTHVESLGNVLAIGSFILVQLIISAVRITHHTEGNGSRGSHARDKNILRLLLRDDFDVLLFVFSEIGGFGLHFLS